jgi:hypothetical protein
LLQLNGPGVPQDHPVRRLFSDLTQRGLGQTPVGDEASVRYIADVMTEFIGMEGLYPVHGADGERLDHLSDLLAAGEQLREPGLRRDHFKYLGDLTLFMLGLFPEYFRRRRRALSPDFYVTAGRRSYRSVAEMVRAPSELAVFQKLADEYEHYVEGLRWVRLYIRDPFFQYMFREFGVTRG